MIAREGLPFILIGLALVIVVFWIAARYDSKTAFVITIVLAILTVFTGFFFRNPVRAIPPGDGVLVSPADGKVVAIVNETHPHIGAVKRISIFLSVFDVHINRVPAEGRVDYVKYIPGKFFAAFYEKASQLNEQTEIGMTSTGGHKIVFKQIAGLIARRIVYHLEEGQEVDRGERFGLIRFGSRTDLMVPADSEIEIEVGQHVDGGSTIVGYLPGASGQKSAATREAEHGN